MDKLHSCFQQYPFLESRSVYCSVHFPIFCSCFSAFRRNDFGVEPFPSLQASGKLFWDAGNNFWQPKTQLAMFAWTWIFLPKNQNVAFYPLPDNKTLPPPSLSLLEYPKSQLPGHLGGVTGWHMVSQTVSRPPWLRQSGNFIVILPHVRTRPVAQLSMCSSSTGCIITSDLWVTGERKHIRT